ncbi:DUF1801 domain-containing protein [Marinoscillum sp.]|uniref:DUF1801 domain-containing protein n=1 Tax=Marinoscillum sp. TaxID=2024838 RepID=UPI003BACDFE3
MQYEATNPDDYLGQLQNDWRKEKLLWIRQLLLGYSELDEGMEYKMLRYGNDKSSLFHLNAQKNYVSLYVGDTKKIDPSGALLKDFDLGKGCIRIKKSIDLEATSLPAFIDMALQRWKAGLDLSC